jgi:hypothetical protein
MTPLEELSARRRDLSLTKNYTHKKHLYPGGIRSHNPQKREAADTCHKSRARGPAYVLIKYIYYIKNYIF